MIACYDIKLLSVGIVLFSLIFLAFTHFQEYEQKTPPKITEGYLAIDAVFTYSFELNEKELICERYEHEKQDKAVFRVANPEKVRKICNKIISEIDPAPADFPFPPPGPLMIIDLEKGESKMYPFETESPLVYDLLRELESMFEE